MKGLQKHIKPVTVFNKLLNQTQPGPCCQLSWLSCTIALSCSMSSPKINVIGKKEGAAGSLSQEAQQQPRAAVLSKAGLKAESTTMGR